MQRKSILFIAQPFAPHGGSHATRVNGFVEELASLGFEVTVLTTSLHKGIPNLDHDLLKQVAGAKAIRAFCGPLHFTSYLLGRWAKSSDRPRGIAARKSILIPDTYVEWVPFAIAALTFRWLADRWKPDLIVSTAMPNSCHLVGLWAKSLLRSPWIADFGDPWILESSIKRGAIRGAIERRMEAAVLKGADVVTWTTNSAREEYSRRYPTLAKKMHVIPMGYRTSDFSSRPETHEIRCPDEIRLVYAGRLSPEHRDSSRFLNLFRSLNKLGKYRLIVAGTELHGLGDAANDLRANDIDALGSLNHTAFVNLLNDADVLVLLGNRSPLQVPGKVFQYIGARKPILYVKNMPPSEPDETEGILRLAGVSYHVVESRGELNLDAVARFIQHSRDELVMPPNVDQHSWSSRVHDLLRLATP